MSRCLAVIEGNQYANQRMGILLSSSSCERTILLFSLACSRVVYNRTDYLSYPGNHDDDDDGDARMINGVRGELK